MTTLFRLSIFFVCVGLESPVLMDAGADAPSGGTGRASNPAPVQWNAVRNVYINRATRPRFQARLENRSVSLHQISREGWGYFLQVWPRACISSLKETAASHTYAKHRKSDSVT